MHNPNNLSLLYETNYGTIFRCDCCNKLQVQCKHFLLHQSASRFASFNVQLENLLNNPIAKSAAPDNQFRFSAGELTLKLYLDEVIALQALYGGALAMLELQEILNENL